MTKLIDLKDKLEWKAMLSDLRRAVDKVLAEGTPQQQQEAQAYLRKMEFRFSLLQQVLDAGYDPKEFLVVPTEGL